MFIINIEEISALDMNSCCVSTTPIEIPIDEELPTYTYTVRVHGSCQKMIIKVPYLGPTHPLPLLELLKRPLTIFSLSTNVTKQMYGMMSPCFDKRACVLCFAF